MNRVIKVLLCIVCIGTLFGCTNPVPKKKSYKSEYIEKIKKLDILLRQDIIEDKAYKDHPWVQDRLSLIHTNIVVSMDLLRNEVLGYEFITHTDLKLSAEDIINLYTNKDKKKYARFNRFYRWYTAAGKKKINIYNNGINAIYKQYQEINGHLYRDKNLEYCAAIELNDLAKWSMEHVDYKVLKRTYVNRKSAKDIHRWYFNFMVLMDQIDSKGNAIQTEEV